MQYLEGKWHNSNLIDPMLVEVGDINRVAVLLVVACTLVVIREAVVVVDTVEARVGATIKTGDNRFFIVGEGVEGIHTEARTEAATQV